LLAAPKAREYYGPLGFEQHPSAWTLKKAWKENSPTSGLLRFLVARGGIEPPTQGFSNILR
jgi:hypothetical protein